MNKGLSLKTCIETGVYSERIDRKSSPPICIQIMLLWDEKNDKAAQIQLRHDLFPPYPERHIRAARLGDLSYIWIPGPLVACSNLSSSKALFMSGRESGDSQCKHPAPIFAYSMTFFCKLNT